MTCNLVRNIVLAAIAGSCLPAAAQEIVVPNALANAEGGTANAFPWANISQNHRNQQVYASSEFAALSGPHRLVGVRFRPNATSTYPAWSTTVDLELRFSIVQLRPDELVSTFASNIGANETLVLSGPVTYGTSQPGPSAPGPMAFDIEFMFQTPFEYNPALGNLLMDMHRTSTTIGTNRFLDAHSVVGDSISRVYSSTAGAATGSVDSIGIPTQFIFEPLTGDCYANCDASTEPPVLNVADFTCFLQSFAAGDAYANCDASTEPPVLNVADFTCFLQQFAAGCP